MTNKGGEIVVGLDIGTTKIVAMVGRKNEHGKLEILGMGKAASAGVTRGVVTHITPTVDSIRQAINKAQEMSKVEIGEANVGIAGQHIRSIQHGGVLMRQSLEDEISQKDIEDLKQDMYKLVMLPGEEIIDVLPQDFSVDNERGVLDPIGMSGLRLEGNFHIITAQVAAINNITRCVERASLDRMGLTLEPLASSEAVLNEEEKEAGVVLVDIGGGTTDVAIFQENVIRHTAVIPFGGNVITEDVKEGCAIIRKQAELLKVKFGSALASESQENEIVVIPGLNGRPPKEISVRNLSNIIQARMEEIIEQVYYEIRNSGYENKLIAGIVVTGGGSQLRHIAQLFEFITGMDTRVGYPTEHLAHTSENSGLDEITSPMYSTSVGLVLKGFEELQRRSYTQQHNKKEAAKSEKKPSKFLDRILQISSKALDEGLN
jgi:cell division protein FtsA